MDLYNKIKANIFLLIVSLAALVISIGGILKLNTYGFYWGCISALMWGYLSFKNISYLAENIRKMK